MKSIVRSLVFLLLLLSVLSLRAQVPALNSYPSATATIFLDFDGHTVEGTSWNFTGPIYCGPSNLTNTQITEIFHRVAEDYRPFNVNITTDSARYLAAPLTQRIRIIHTITSDWYGNVGGVSYYGSFNWGDNTPAFVFSALLNYNTKMVAEASSHEIGHSLGLRHQTLFDNNCTKLAEYNAGHGTGEIGWAPIMGVGYYRNQTLWNNGTDPYGCNSFQDDLTMITTANGFGYREDDYGQSFGGGAERIHFSSNQFLTSGVIERSTDVDVMRFTMPITGRFTLKALPFSVGSGNSGANLDVQVELMTGSNNVIGTYNPAGLLNALIDTTLMAGNYFLRVQGKGNINAPQFASLGSYSLEGNFSSSVLPLRKLELSGRVNGTVHHFQWAVDADERLVEQVLETSVDGRNFTAVVSPAVGERKFSFSTANAAYYRLLVRFDNGRSYYSNIIALRTDVASKPYLVNNAVQHTVMIQSPATGFQYQVVDFNGRRMGAGNVQKGTTTIASGHWPGGWYAVHISNGVDQYSYKVFKQ